MTAIKTKYALGIEVGEALLGTSEQLSNMLEAMDLDRHLDDDLDFCAGLDGVALMCESCNWWCEPSDMSEAFDMTCRDCASSAPTEEEE